MISKTQEKIQHQFLFSLLLQDKTTPSAIWAAQISLLLSPLKETWSNCSSFFFISKCLWISETLQGPAPGQGQQRQCRSSALPGPTGSPFPGAGGEDSLMFTEKRKSFFSSQQEVGWGQEALFGTGHTTASPESKVFPQLRSDQENKQTATCKTCS